MSKSRRAVTAAFVVLVMATGCNSEGSSPKDGDSSPKASRSSHPPKDSTPEIVKAARLVPGTNVAGTSDFIEKQRQVLHYSKKVGKLANQLVRAGFRLSEGSNPPVLLYRRVEPNIRVNLRADGSAFAELDFATKSCTTKKGRPTTPTELTRLANVFYLFIQGTSSKSSITCSKRK